MYVDLRMGVRAHCETMNIIEFGVTQGVRTYVVQRRYVTYSRCEGGRRIMNLGIAIEFGGIEKMWWHRMWRPRIWRDQKITAGVPLRRYEIF